jgi:cardiolipin synthase
VIIANAYFFPGYRLLRQLRRAARRGVDVHLILQGQPDMPIVKTAAELLYEPLQRDGVHVHEYCKRPLHGKVAVVDGYWSTVGSSNLDPLSLALNLEANVIVRDHAFGDCLRSRLQHLMDHECRRARIAPPSRWSFWPQLRSAVVFHFLRHFSTWAAYLPRHAPKLKVLQAPPTRRGAPGNRGRSEVESMEGARGR